MVVVLAELALIVLLIGLTALVVWAAWTALRAADSRPARLPTRERALVAAAIAQARWVPAHDEADGTTRVLVRRVYTGLDGRPEVLEEREIETFPARDPAWEARFTEAMSQARFRCSYLNAEESQ